MKKPTHFQEFTKALTQYFHDSETINIALFYFFLLLGVLALKIPGGIGIVISLISFALIVFPVTKSSLLKKWFLLITIISSSAAFVGILIFLLIQFLVDINVFTVKIGGSTELVIALVTLLAAVLTFTAGKMIEHWLDTQKELANEIRPTYKKFNCFLIALLEESLSNQERERFVIEINEGIFSWGSYGVKKHWKQVRADLLSKGLSDQDLLSKLGNLRLALRKQVGLPDESVNYLSEFLDLKVKKH